MADPHWDLFVFDFDGTICDSANIKTEAYAVLYLDEGEEIVAPDAPQPTGVVDLMEALKASVEAAKQKRAAS